MANQGKAKVVLFALDFLVSITRTKPPQSASLIEKSNACFSALELVEE
jgi:hypothetical protein